MRIYKCTICKFTHKDKQTMGKHYQLKHRDSIPDNMSGYQWFYYLLTGKDRGSCIICKQNTEFNEVTMKYSRFCPNPECKNKYREEFKNRMIKKYGKIHLLNDPEKQKEMLANRRISGHYDWHDKSVRIPYTGSFELDFLKFLDIQLNWNSNDIMFPSPHVFTYEYNGTSHFYIPDGYIPSLNLQIEIKDGGGALNINKDSRAKDVIKDELMRSMHTYFSYIRIDNKNYTEFIKLIKGV